MKSRSIVSLFMLMFVLLMSSVAGAAPTAAEITGEIEKLTLDDPTNVYSGGVIIVGGTQVILPKNLLIDLPANRLSLQQIFAQAPAACVALNESGLAKSDKCNASGTGGFATLSAVHSNAGNIIAGDVLIEKGKEVVSGVVSYINYTDGYFRVNGIPGDATTGVMVRLNDPTSKHTVQQGAGCAGGTNCSPDPRFNLDPDNYTNVYSSGYPLCIPSTTTRNFPGLSALAGIPAVAAGPTQAAANGTGDKLCPSTNRTPGVIAEPPVNDSRVFAPIMVGDSVKAEGNYEAISGTRFLSSHTTRINRALTTKNQAGQPDYMFLEEVFVEAPGFQNQRTRMLIIGFATLAPTDIDFWTIHRDPTTNAVHEFPLASVAGCDIANGVGIGGGQCSAQGLVGAGGNIFRIRYDVDFLLAAANDPKFPGGAKATLNPCWHLLNSPRFTVSNPGLCPGGNASGAGITLANNFGIMSPIPHEIQARTGHSLDAPANSLRTYDIVGAPAATNGQYLFPFGINLGGLETADFLEIDINLLDTPRIFEGIPWNLDRRLSPSGCLKAGGCEGTPQPLDPFPFTNLDPRLQAEFLVAGLPGGTPKGAYSDPNFTASVLSNASNRVFSYVDAALGKFNGNTTLLPCATGVFPANCPPDPALIAIVPTPVLNIFPPVADEDAATTFPGVPVTVAVLANDFPVFGTMDPTSVQIASNPASGTAVANADGTITYIPTPAFTVGTVTFTYTVANNFGSRSLPGTVTISINPPAVMITPAAGSTFSGPSQTFTWNNAGADVYVVWVGTTAGGNDIGVFPLSGAGTTATSLTITGLPTNGSTLYVRLFSKFGSNYSFTDSSYTAINAATMLTPTAGSTLAPLSQTFTWSNAGADVYVVWVGTTPGGNNVGVFPLSGAGTTGTSTTVTGLPNNGSTLYVRLFSKFGGTYTYIDYIYSSASSAPPAAMLAPAAGSTLSGASQAFTWNNAGADVYVVWVGTTAGGNDIGVFPSSGAGTTATSLTIAGIPTNGSTIHVRLFSKFGSTYVFNDYSYVTAITTAATMQTPANGATLASSTQDFSWSSVGADVYVVWVGTTPGGNDIGVFPLSGTGTTSTTTTITGLPANGSTTYVRLFSKFGATYNFNDYIYH